MRGSAGGLEKLSAGVSGLVKKTLDCTVRVQNLIYCKVILWLDEFHYENFDVRRCTNLMSYKCI